MSSSASAPLVRLQSLAHAQAKEPVHPHTSGSSLRELIALSDASTVKSKEEFAQRIEQPMHCLSQIKTHAEPSAFYKVITNQAVQSVQEGRYDDNIWGADRLLTSVLYLENLHAHLTGGRVSAGWRRYYELADNPTSALSASLCGRNGPPRGRPAQLPRSHWNWPRAGR